MDLISCNVVSVTMMTRVVLPKMAEKRKGLIINLASISAESSVPLLSLYGATKVSMNLLGWVHLISFLVDLSRSSVTGSRDV